MKYFMIAWFAFCALLGLGFMAFIVWVIIKLLTHFGIV